LHSFKHVKICILTSDEGVEGVIAELEPNVEVVVVLELEPNGEVVGVTELELNGDVVDALDDPHLGDDAPLNANDDLLVSLPNTKDILVIKFYYFSFYE
jgi:hypothetical protein